MPRKQLDFYETPPHYVDALKKYIGEPRRIIDPCAGAGAIVDEFLFSDVVTNDIAPEHEADYHLDAKDVALWYRLGKGAIITNPPYTEAFEILQTAYHYTDNPIALCLRLSFLEPTKKRRDFLTKNPPTGLVVLPRYSFRRNDKGYKQTDSVTCAWMLWRWHHEHFGVNIEP